MSARALCYHEPAERFFISALDRLKGRSVSHDAVRPLWTEDAMRHAAGHCGPEWKAKTRKGQEIWGDDFLKEEDVFGEEAS